MARISPTLRELCAAAASSFNCMTSCSSTLIAPSAVTGWSRRYGARPTSVTSGSARRSGAFIALLNAPAANRSATPRKRAARIDEPSAVGKWDAYHADPARVARFPNRTCIEDWTQRSASCSCRPRMRAGPRNDRYRRTRCRRLFPRAPPSGRAASFHHKLLNLWSKTPRESIRNCTRMAFGRARVDSRALRLTGRPLLEFGSSPSAQCPSPQAAERQSPAGSCFGRNSCRGNRGPHAGDCPTVHSD